MISPSQGGREAPAHGSSGDSITESPAQAASPPFLRGFGPPFLLAIVATFTFLTVPRYPYFLDDALSWNAVLNFGHQRGLQFGRDLTFTYGPLGFLLSRYFFPEVAGLRMVADLLLCFSTAASVCLVAWRIGKWWKWLLIAMFILCSANIEPRADLLLYVGLLCWGLLCVVEKGRTFQICCLIFVATAVFASLAKVTFIFVAGLSILAVCCLLLVGGRKEGALGLALGFPTGVVLIWMLAGQDPSNLGRFFAGACAFTRGYDQSMGLDGLPALRIRGMLVLFCALSATIIRVLACFRGSGKRLGWMSAVMAGWIAAIILMVAKHGLVRADLYHAGFLFGFAPVAALIGEVMACASRKALIAARSFGIACCFFSLLTLQSFFVSDLTSFLFQPLRAIPLNIRSVLSPTESRKQMLVELQALRRLTALPHLREKIGQSSVDVFGYDQIYAIFNELNFHPRPVFQSYLAYNAALMRLNDKFYLSRAAPEFVLFNLTPIDRRFPPLEDSFVLRDLLINYEPVDAEGAFLLLKSRSHEMPRLNLLREASVSLRQQIDLLEFGQTNLWMEIDAEPTLLGRVRELFYKPSKIRLKVFPGAADSGFPAPAPMLSAGFLASPLVLRRQDLLKAYTGENVSRPEAYSVDPGPDGARFWKPTVRYRIYQIENRIGQHPP